MTFSPLLLLRSLSILEKPTQDRFKRHDMSRRGSPNESTIHAPKLMSDDVAHANNSMNVSNLVSCLQIRSPHPIQCLTEDLELPFDSRTQHQI